MQGRHICAQSESKRAAYSPGLSCRLGRACADFHFLLVAVDRVTAARTHVLLECFVSGRFVPRPYNIATMPVKKKMFGPLAAKGGGDSVAA